MKYYIGVTSGRARRLFVRDGLEGEAVELAGVSRMRPLFWDTPISWGFTVKAGLSGNAARNTAYTILKDLVGTEAAERYYWKFAEEAVARLKERGFEISEGQIMEWIEQQIVAA
jgi:hypothetical protein